MVVIPHIAVDAYVVEYRDCYKLGSILNNKRGRGNQRVDLGAVSAGHGAG